MTTFEEILHDSIKNYDILQESFINSLKLDEYTSWFYEQSAEILSLTKNDGSELNLKYIPIGTFSSKSNTFMWSWNNKHSIERSKFETLKVKEYGLQNKIFQLNNGVFEANRITAGELSAIALYIIDGMGIYVTQNDEDQLISFKLITEIIDAKTAENLKKEAKSQPDNLIYCSEHGYKRYAFVCQHLNLKEKNGFEEAFETYKDMLLYEDDDFQAWCNLCEAERLKSDGWTDKSTQFAKIELVCEDCYFELKECNKN